MQGIHHKLAIGTLQLLDLLVMTACFTLAAFERSWQADSVSFSSFLSIRIRIVNFILFVAILFIWNRLFSIFGLYHISTVRREIAGVLKAAFVGSVALSALGWASRISFCTTGFVILFWIASSVGAITARLAVRSLLRSLKPRARNLRHLLIVGTNGRSIDFAQKIVSKPELGYSIVGFVEDGWQENREFRQSGYSIVTNFKKFRDFIRKNIVDEVMICLPMKSHYEQSRAIAKSCEEQGIIVRFPSDLFDLELASCNVEMVDKTAVITLRPGAMHGGPLLAKRGLDILLSTTLLALLAPWLILTALLIKLTSLGPVFFIQERVGLNKRKFPLYKFRTMVPDAEKMMKDLEQFNEVAGPVFKIKKDPRITAIGKYLRKTSIDELPQLINVLKGDMSLVGPRPLPIRDYKGFNEDWQRRRFSVRPGITCLWQVNGRSSIAFDKWMEFDMQYIDNWSLWLDIKILAQTLPAVLRGTGSA